MILMDGIEIIKLLYSKVQPILDQQGIKATANYADRPDKRQQPDEFYSERFVKLRAFKIWNISGQFDSSQATHPVFRAN